MLQEHIFDANGVQIHFVQASTSGQPMVLLHGVASQWQSFLPLIPVFARNFKVYALDLRGHGKSSRVSGKYHLFDYARDIQSFLDEYIGQPTILYGHSLGGQIAMTVAAQAPAAVRALVLGEIPFYYHHREIKDTHWYEPFKELHYVLSSFHSMKEIDDYMAEQYPNMAEQRRKHRAEILSHVDPGTVLAILQDRHVEGYDTDAVLRKITCRVLLIQGNPKLGAALLDEDVAYLAERIQHHDVLYMQDIGHGLPSGETLTRLEKFLESD